MAKKVVADKKVGMNTKLFLLAIQEMEEKKGIPTEKTVKALKEAIEGALRTKGYEDTMFRTEISLEEAKIEIFGLFHVVDTVNDDVLEISREDASAKLLEVPGAFIDAENNLNLPISIDNFTTAQAKKCQNIFIQKIREIEKAIIYEAYSNKVGENVTVSVEKVEDRFIFINLGKTTITMDNRQLIGRETFRVGDQIRVYLSKVDSSSQGPQIVVSRADPNFLKRLFEEENRDVYDGTVIIRNIAREAGERSKVSVESTDPNVDPVGACIGPGGTKIQKICNQINHEKIDVVQYHVSPGLFIAEALKPAEIVGVYIVSEEEKKAIAVVKDGGLKIAIGKKGVNARLAGALTEYHIDILEESIAREQNVPFVTMERMKEQEDALIYEIRRQKIMEENKKKEEERLKRIKEEEAQLKAKAQEEENKTSQEKEVIQEEVKEEFIPEVNEPKVEETVEYNPVITGQRVNLEELERQIEEEKKKNNNKQNFRKKKEEVEEEEEVEEKKVDRSNYLDIYTDEELEELDEEERENEEYDEDDEDEDIDYDEYDEYYED